ncbi:MAG: sugar phosphate isomerase/epimerase [Chloroherpetonaceae bacterium]|nr:sugar phosphate isomerase/epimerase [Chthonomonadaceae bacterium]MDW8207550.1 sugar phosphate isomerase/epimerase [Chloroherpetonaceae bacterium]
MSLPLVLCAYSLPHVMGYLATRDGTPCSRPLTATDLMDAATAMGLNGVELPLGSLIPAFDGAQVAVADPTGDIGAELSRRGLTLIADYGVLLDHDADHLLAYLTQASQAGARVVRALLSHLLCGDRRPLPGGWERHRAAVALRLREVLPHAEALGVCIAVENHQDATSEDLLWIAEQVRYSPAFGVTLDTGNPLAVGEDPVAYTRRIAPLVRHLHLKDYTMYFAPTGYRLVRCAAGDGVVDFPEILRIVRSANPGILPAVEVAAQATRTIPLLEEDWWEHYPASQARHLPGALRLLWAHGRPMHAPYSSAWERGESSAIVCAEEWDMVRRSVQYLRYLLTAEPDIARNDMGATSGPDNVSESSTPVV